MPSTVYPKSQPKTLVKPAQKTCKISEKALNPKPQLIGRLTQTVFLEAWFRIAELAWCGDVDWIRFAFFVFRFRVLIWLVAW